MTERSDVERALRRFDAEPDAEPDAEADAATRSAVMAAYDARAVERRATQRPRSWAPLRAAVALCLFASVFMLGRWSVQPPNTDTTPSPVERSHLEVASEWQTAAADLLRVNR